MLASNIWKFYLYKFVRGLWIPATIFTLYLLARGLDFTQIGITDIVVTLAVLLLEIPSGGFADLIGRKKSVFLGYTLIAIAILFTGLTGQFYLLVLIMVIFGAGESLYSGAEDALIYDTLKELKRENEYTKISGKSGALFSIGSICGGFLGAYLFTLNISYPFFIGAFAFFLAGLVYLTMEETNQKTKYSIKKHYQLIIDGLKYVKSHTQVKWIIAYSASIFMVFNYQIFIVQPSLQQFGFDVKFFGLLFALIWGFEALIYWQAHRILDYLGEKKSLFLIALIHFICFIILSLINIWVGLIFIIINYFGRGLFYPISSNFIQKHIESSHRATALSIQNFVVSLISIFGILLLSILTDFWGINLVYLTVGLITLALTAVLYWTFPKN